MNTKRKKNGATYTELHGALRDMNEVDVRKALRAELTRTDRPARVDYVQRLVGRYNRLRANRTMRAVLALLSVDGKRNLDAALDSRFVVAAPAKKQTAASAPASNG
jgi:hypothetical protein